MFEVELIQQLYCWVTIGSRGAEKEIVKKVQVLQTLVKYLIAKIDSFIVIYTFNSSISSVGFDLCHFRSLPFVLVFMVIFIHFHNLLEFTVHLASKYQNNTISDYLLAGDETNSKHHTWNWLPLKPFPELHAKKGSLETDPWYNLLF